MQELMPKDAKTPAEYLPAQVHAVWEHKHNKTVRESLKQVWRESFVKPLKDLVKYLQEEHVQYCPPDEVSNWCLIIPYFYCIPLRGIVKRNRFITVPLTR